MYGGSYKTASEKYGLVIWLRYDWHIHTPYSIHHDKQYREEVQREVQLKAMEYYGWTEDDFRNLIGRSFL